MRIISRLNLKNQLLLLVAISTLMIFSLQIFYYSKFYSLAEDKENVHTSRIIRQVEENIISFTQDIKDAALASSYNTVIHDYMGSDDPIYRLKLNKNVLEIISGIKASNKNIESIILVDKERNIVGASSPFDYLILGELEKKYHPDMRYPESQFFGKIYNPEKMEKLAYIYVHPVFSSLNETNGFTELGMVIVVYKTEIMDRILTDIKATPSSLLLILDSEYNVVSADERFMKGSLFDSEILKGIDSHIKDQQIQFREKLNHVQAKDIEQLNWKIVSLIPVNEMTDELRLVRNIGFIIGAVMTLLILIMGLIFIRSVTVPFGRIVRFVNYIGNNGGKQRLQLPVKNEIGILSIEINKMLDKLDETNELFIQAQTSLYQMEIAKKQAELSFLQSQINPHFLYNTLECIRSIGLANGVMEIVEISTSMAKIFRYSIKEENFVRIRNELECIQDYVRIMSIRYMDKFNVTISVDEDILEMRMPKMILQPIVENAIYHGLERKNGKGVLTITGLVTADHTVRFEISDSGKGMKAEELEKLRHSLRAADPTEGDIASRGLGLLNIHQRIRLAFGEQYGIEIYSIDNEGTQVILHIPLVSNRLEASSENSTLCSETNR
ncbi:sensor histidine kinase [Paenibacillus radicis (ex Xue et al. 2023)]|uniref:Histidine kinase n=1 Tax=Paenibacillus radicis (ex Xue et al. 2023) TaxID=2972489 RepID=A0ABT1YKV6_9BACL|nr:sensor histidine kinase [Paenibacillus radicis (ex Xue et al. 2023)]MCR8632893.1 histidine kinase [Paenibacillus radicis (ex Xue et al. 2023)]